MSARSLSAYALKSLQPGPATGVSVAVHAIPDAFLLMHAGVGCKYKAASQIANHDWDTHPNRREGWTEVGDRALIQGSVGRLGPYARTWYSRREPAFIAVTTGTFLRMTGEDFAGEVERLDAELPCKVALVPTSGSGEDLFVGYARTLLAVAEDIDWRKGARREGEVSLLGYFFDRYEPDHVANLQQLKVLLDGVGLRLGAVLLSGRPYAELGRAAGAGTLVGLPYVRPVERELSATCGREIVATDLPMGLAGTARWLRRVAEVSGADPERTERFIQAQVDHARKQMSKLSDRWRGLRVAVLADTPLAAGLSSMLVELGLRPLLVGLRDESLGGREAFLSSLLQDGSDLPDDVEILERPGLAELKEALSSLVADQRLHVVFGSSVELNLLAGLSPRELGRVSLRPSREAMMPFGVEIGFPSAGYHVTHAAPYLGFGGAVVMTQRILNTPGYIAMMYS